MAQIIDGNRIARSIRSQIRRQAKQLGLTPGLAVVQIGSDPSSTIYVNHKEKDCHRVNFYSEVHRLPADINQNDVLDLISGVITLLREKDIASDGSSGATLLPVISQ